MPRGLGSKKRRTRGVEIIEFTLVFLPLVGFIFLLLDLGWVIYKRATLQFAVREGCRYAITNRTQPLTDSSGNAFGMIDSVKWVVQRKAMGFLGSQTSDPGWSMIQVRFYDPNTSLTSALPLPANCSSTVASPNSGGNLVEVSVENFTASPLAAVLKSANPMVFVARSSDRMEGNPSSGVPHTFNGACP